MNEWRAEKQRDELDTTPQRSPEFIFLFCLSGTMTTRCPQKVFKPQVMNGSHPSLEAPRQPSGAHAQPLHEQHGQEQLTCAKVQASLSRFTTCTVPASCRARSRFLNLRDSVKKSPTKSTAKVVAGCPTARQQQIPWVPFTCHKVLVTGSGAEEACVFSHRQLEVVGAGDGAASVLLEGQEARTSTRSQSQLLP